jgi:hypothetical protein
VTSPVKPTDTTTFSGFSVAGLTFLTGLERDNTKRYLDALKCASSRLHGSRAGRDLPRMVVVRYALFGAVECRLGSRQARHEHSGEGPAVLVDQPAQYVDPFHPRLCGGRLDQRQPADHALERSQGGLPLPSVVLKVADQRRRHRLPPKRAALLPQQDQALLGVQIHRPQRQRRTPAGTPYPYATGSAAHPARDHHRCWRPLR